MERNGEYINPRRFFDLAVAPLGPGIISTLLRVAAWASSIQSDTPAFVPTPLPGSTACDVIERFAQALISDAPAFEWLLLRKSLQEAFLYCIDLDTDLTSDEITTRLTQFVDRHGKAAFIQQFLSLYFFNVVWLELSQSFGTPALDESERTMNDLEGMCQRGVIAAYADVKDRSTAERLIHNIQAELQELMKLAA